MIIDGQEYNIQIIGKNHDTYASGGVAPLTFWIVELYNDEAQMNETRDNTTGWANSKMRTTTLVDIFSKMPSAIRTAIRPVNKQTLKGDYSGLETTADKLFLFSETEIFGTTNQSNGFAEGAQYELNAGYWKYWYKDYVGGTEGDLPWFLRGPNAKDSETFSGVSYYTSVANPYADTLQGFSFGFCF